MGLYLLGILVGAMVAITKKIITKQTSATPFVMELPNYRLPRLKNVVHLLWDKIRDFLEKAFTIIFIASIVIWFMQSFDFRFHLVENGENSMLAWIAGLIAPIFQPMGLGDWRIVTSLFSGLIAKESVVATIDVLGGVDIFTTLTAIPMLVFCLLYTPCVAAVTAVKRELGWKWAVFVILFQCAIAWVLAWFAYLIAGTIL